MPDDNKVQRLDMSPISVGSAETQQLQRENRQLQADNARLRAIVDRLPKTADGCVVLPGLTYWTNDTGFPTSFKASLRAQWDKYPIHAEGLGRNLAGTECYSTRAAAEQAAKETP